MKQFTHGTEEEGTLRVCTWDEDEGGWLWRKEDAMVRCHMAHPAGKIKDVADRGEFGMPGIGMAGTITQMTLTPVEAVAVEWRAILDADGLSVTFADGKGFDQPATTDDAKYIMEIVPEILGHFLGKNTQYARAQSGHDLGVKGIIPDINRKTAALITRFWDRDGECFRDEDSNEELIDDLIGHLLLMRARLRTSY